MFSVDLTTHDCDGHVVVALRGELDMADAADVAAALTVVIAREPEIIIDLAGLEFIDSSGVAALARSRKLALLASSRASRLRGCDMNPACDPLRFRRSARIARNRSA
jgi:anti-anti-sigma factor